MLRDGQELAKLPKTPVDRFGRPLFQSMTYHEHTGLAFAGNPILRRNLQLVAKHSYQIITVNSVGLKSEPSIKTEPHPRANTSTSYRVDPTRPETRDKLGWGPMSGVAVDAQDDVWVLARSNPPVRV